MTEARRSFAVLAAFLAAVLFTAASVIPAIGQTATLRGFVTDQVSEQLLQGATVAVRDSSGVLRGTVTDGDGYFILRGIPAGRHSVSVSFIGYVSWEEQITLAGGDIIVRNIDLLPADVELDEVVVQGKRPAGVSSVVAGLQTIDPAQIDRVPVLGISGDLAAYLQTVPGVLNQGDRGGQYFIRGGALDQNLSLIDGLPVYMPFHVLSFYSAFPEEVIDTARLYTG
ncbi:MAG: TonB-dependent receptor, partial [Rhodothermales bacterium]|nr:TonB-dependent receptor [Rhodothermales bacterium]